MQRNIENYSLLRRGSLAHVSSSSSNKSSSNTSPPSSSSKMSQSQGREQDSDSTFIDRTEFLITKVSFSVHTSGGKQGPNPRFSPPRPRIFGDRAGMGTWYEKTLGIFWGRGWVENWGFFLGFIPENPPKKLGIFQGRG